MFRKMCLTYLCVCFAQDEVEAKIVVAGLSTTCSQKIHNQLVHTKFSSCCLYFAREKKKKNLCLVLALCSGNYVWARLKDLLLLILVSRQRETSCSFSMSVWNLISRRA